MVCAFIRVHLSSAGKCMMHRKKTALISGIESHKWKIKLFNLQLFCKCWLLAACTGPEVTLLVCFHILTEWIICGQLLHTADQTPFRACVGENRRFLWPISWSRSIWIKGSVNSCHLCSTRTKIKQSSPVWALPAWDESLVLTGLILWAGIAAFRSIGSFRKTRGGVIIR